MSSKAGVMAAESASGSREKSCTGSLIINADDWGRNPGTSDAILDCAVRGTVSSVSAMVFMEDSERAAAIARERKIDAGLHLNFTAPFSGRGCPSHLVERQQEVARHLPRRGIARAVFYPRLIRSFEYLVAAQLDEFNRLYGVTPARIDGHHHMHLCANVLFGGLLPPGTVVRRNFSFQPGEKNLLNRLYRQVVDRILARRHRLVDFFFTLLPLEPTGRLEQIFSLAHRFVVEIETHPANPEEHQFLAGGEIFRRVGDLPIAPRFAVLRPSCPGMPAAS